ncbi:hypothetical protein [Nannocystis pusilla]|uniref:hypothetical protein n=1 Tax=Nannocystis pusilla TaxID=889268 RepID=UPI003DA3BACA
MRRICGWSLVLVACGPRPLDDSATDDASTDASGSSVTSVSTTGAQTTNVSMTGPMTTGPMTTEPASSGPMPATDPGTSTTTTTTEPLTGGTSSTVTTDITTSGEPSGTTGDRLDLPPAPPDANLVGCTLDAPPGTAITGSTVLGPFEADRAYFGGQHADGDLVMPTFMFLSPGALANVELWQQLGTTGEIIHGVALTQPFNAWVGGWTLDGDIITGNSVDPVAIQLEITGFAGNWSVADPSDPPRLLGALSGDVAGTFDAVFCDHLNIIPPP